MTMRDKRGRYIKRQPVPMRTHWSDNLAAKIRATPPWVVFLWLALTAVLYAYVGKLVVIAFLFWLAIRGWIWFCGKYPRTALFVFAFLQGLLGGRRRRW